MITDVSAYLGIPYSELRCWQLCRRVYAEMLGLELPDYPLAMADGSAPVTAYLDLEVGRAAWAEIPLADVRPMDILQMRMLRPKDHVGIVVSVRPRLVLTTMRTLGSMVADWAPVGPRPSHHTLRAECGWRHPSCL